MSVITSCTGSRRAPRALAVGVVVSALALAACAPVEEPGGSGDESNGADEDQATTGGGDVEGDVDPDGVLRFAMHVGPRDWDPHTETSATMNAALFPVYDRLIHLTPDSQPAPGLAEDWEFNDEADVLTLRLRDGVTFHDGEPFDADAVLANYERQTTLEDSGSAGELASVERVEVVGDLEVEYHLDGPNVAILGVLADRAGMMLSPAAFEEDMLEYAAGAGMFQLEAFEVDQSISFARHDDYWDPDALQLAGMEWSIIPDERTRMNALQSGQLDAAMGRDGSLLTELDSAGFIVDETPTLEFDQLYMNRTMPPMDDENFRLAVNHAIDREAVAEGVTRGWATAMDQPFPEDYWAHADGAGYDYDPDRARELLESVDAEPTFTALDIAGSTTTGLTEAVQDQLRQVGIEMEIMRVEAGGRAHFPFAPEFEVEVMAVEWTGRPDPTQTLGLVHPDTFLNAGGHTTDEFMELYRDGRAIADQAERAPVIHETVRVVREQGLLVPLMSKLNQLVTTDQVGGTETWISGIEFRGVHMTEG